MTTFFIIVGVCTVSAALMEGIVRLDTPKEKNRGKRT